jgi:hypothetical protein
MVTQVPTQDTAILSRLFDAASADFTAEFARYIADLSFGTADRLRMQELAQKARDGELTETEQVEIDSYERVGHVLNILQAKSRLRLQRTTDDFLV